MSDPSVLPLIFPFFLTIYWLAVRSSFPVLGKIPRLKLSGAQLPAYQTGERLLIPAIEALINYTVL